jgi:prolyl-tRNA editing enzyme YbaK/EbsC (Cys-tRNA(Pro) deacylase)
LFKKQLDARVVSLAPLDYVLKQTQMEYGSITVIGLPSDWPIFVDSKLVKLTRVVIGGGLVKSKLSLSGKALSEVPNVIVIEGLANVS